MELIEIINYKALKNCKERLSNVIDSLPKDIEARDAFVERCNMNMIELKRALNDLRLAIGNISTGEHSNESFKITQLEIDFRKYNKTK